MNWKIAILAVLTAIIPALATAADTKAIVACLAKADEAGTYGNECIGLVADPCMKDAAAKADDMATIACAKQELPFWQGRVQPEINRIKKVGAFKDINKAVDDSQQTWRRMSDAICSTFKEANKLQTPGGVEYCLLQQTAARVLILHRVNQIFTEP